MKVFKYYYMFETSYLHQSFTICVLKQKNVEMKLVLIIYLWLPTSVVFFFWHSSFWKCHCGSFFSLSRSKALRLPTQANWNEWKEMHSALISHIKKFFLMKSFEWLFCHGNEMKYTIVFKKKSEKLMYWEYDGKKWAKITSLVVIWLFLGFSK